MFLSQLVTALGRRCRFCGCTPEEPCKVPGGDECAYCGPKGDRCSAPACVLAYEAERNKAELDYRIYRKVSRAAREKTRRAKKSRAKSGRTGRAA